MPPVRMTGVEPVMAGIPDVGEHSEAILGELGFDASTIEDWKRSRMV